MISAEKARSSISMSCRLLGVSRSGYYDWERRAPSDRALTDAWLTEKIRAIHKAHRTVYGSPRIHADLRLAHDVHVGRKRVERLMREAGISGLQQRQRGRTTVSVPGVRVADDLVERQFFPAAPNVLWIADVTYLRTWEGWLYLAAVQDAYSRRIVGWAMADHMRSELVVDALRMAVNRRRPAAGLIHHSDQGSQGGFKWSLQRLDDEGLLWASRGGVGLTGRGGRRCVRLVAREWRGVRIGSGSGRRSLRGCRVIGRAWPRVCRPRSASGGFVRVAGCHRLAGRRCRDAICPLRSGRRSRSRGRWAAGCVRSPGGWAGRRRRSRGSCAATPRLGVAGWSIGPRRRSGTPSGGRGAPRRPSWPPTRGCAATYRTASAV
jgi:putative transposase